MHNEGKKERYAKAFVPLAFLLLLALALVYLNSVRVRSAVGKVTRNTDTMLAGYLMEHHPEIPPETVLDVINNRDGNKNASKEEAELLQREGEEFLQTYGYDANYESRSAARIIRNGHIIDLLILAAACLLATLIFVLRDRRRREEIDRATGYLRKLNDGSYDLMLSDNTEEELSRLKNEIYRTTVILREIAEEKTKESKRLSQSMEDISHQLRTPLASMSIMIDNICDDPEMPADIRNEFLKDILDQVGWMSELVNSLLTLAKFDAGAVVMKREPVDVSMLLDEAVDRLGILLDVRDVEVVRETNVEKEGAAPVVITGDRKWQLEAISNIIKNCAEHSPAGSKIHLKVSDNSIYTCIEVRDEGEGILPEDLRHIFERFYKAKNSRPESIGIGLSLAKSIVEAAGGRITVESEPGCGSTFTIKYYK